VTKYNSVEKMWSKGHKKEVQFKTNYPILWFLREVYYWFYRLWHNRISQWPKETKWFIQRGKRGWADCDIWSFDGYLSEVIWKGLKKLQKIQHILPTWKPGIKEEDAKKEWDYILNEMIWAFQSWDLACNGHYEFWFAGRSQIYEKTMMEKYPDYHFMTEEEDKRMRNGMKLFIENFGSLWD
jgi:hypothetical protein